jgi:hypothetical protein
MNDYFLLMHDDVPQPPLPTTATWDNYLEKLKASGRFGGGSSIGSGACVSRSDQAKSLTTHLSGYIRIQAEDLDDARRLVDGNPVYEAGGTVEIRELPRD